MEWWGCVVKGEEILFEVVEVIVLPLVSLWVRWLGCCVGDWFVSGGGM